MNAVKRGKALKLLLRPVLQSSSKEISIYLERTMTRKFLDLYILGVKLKLESMGIEPKDIDKYIEYLKKVRIVKSRFKNPDEVQAMIEKIKEEYVSMGLRRDVLELISGLV